MTLSKIQLSDAELQLICNADLILTKNKALEKIRLLLEAAQQQMQDYVVQQQWQADIIFQNPPKVSRGEQYLGLPWLILDYPRQFTQDHVFAIRSMFWWGHFFSSTLHLAGRFAKPETLAAAYPVLQDHYIGIHTDPWQHHFEKDNYRAVKELTEQEWVDALQQQPHIKIAARWPVTGWAAAPEKLMQNWKMMLQVVNYP